MGGFILFSRVPVATMDCLMVAANCGTADSLAEEMTSRVVPYDPDLKCDYCGNIGGSDYMGDNICDSCLIDYSGRNSDEDWGISEVRVYDHALSTQEIVDIYNQDNEIPNCFYADPPTLREFFEGIVEWIKLEIKCLLSRS